ncbi:YciI family protein [Frigidibacter sp. MR17.14]|uniref:YciI family protein n=1 Tax=Frigidibacter sp. MR17.14 TaxID=3126509 RepID=UPI003012D411
MRVMVLVKASEASEAGVLPTTADLEAMGAFNEALAAAGILREGDGLKPSAKGVRVVFDGPGREIVPGPFAAVSELLAGYWIWEVADMEEAVAWVLRAPNPMPMRSEIEIRPFYEPEDFGPALTPELAAQEEALRHKLAKE